MRIRSPKKKRMSKINLLVHMKEALKKEDFLIRALRMEVNSLQRILDRLIIEALQRIWSVVVDMASKDEESEKGLIWVGCCAMSCNQSESI